MAHHFTHAGFTYNAIDCLRRAGRRSVDLSAHIEASAHFKSALDLLEELPPSEQRNVQNLDLTLGLAIPLVAVHGFGALCVEECALRAMDLSERFQVSPARFTARRLAWHSCLMRQPLPKTVALAQDLASLGQVLANRGERRQAVAAGFLADDDAVLVVDENGFLQGKSSCGVARQYTGSAGKITNCQIGVYVLRHRHAFIDRALYLPKSWTDDPARLKATYVPDDVVFATKPHLAARMIDRATATSVPFRWVAGGTVYGVGDIERDLREAGKGCVLGVGASRVSILGQATKHCGNRCGDCPSAGSV